MAIRPVYSKLVLPSRKSLEIIINIKIKIRSNTVCISLQQKYYFRLVAGKSFNRFKYMAATVNADRS